jgi:menaquinone-dependent protoporphyrinogen oxidase
MADNPISRRDFLKAAGLTLTAGAFACSGLGYAASRPPEIETPEHTFGKDNLMNDRILITYATRAGSTAEIAAEIGKSFRQKNFAVDVKPVKEKPFLAGYSAVILGSAIRMGSWLSEAVDYVEANQEKLNAMPVALFTVHMLNTGEDEASRANRLAYLDKVRSLLKGAEEVYFEGAMDFSKLSFLDRMIAKMVKAVEADNRDWEKIRTWVPGVLARITS